MEKVKVSKEMHEVLLQLKTLGTEDFILKTHARELGFVTPTFDLLNKLSTMELAEILIKGYEVEKTPQEKILEYYNHCVSESKIKARDFDKGYWEGAKHAILNILEFKKEIIKGIND